MPNDIAELMDSSILLMPNWKWIALVIFTAAGLTLRKVIQK